MFPPIRPRPTIPNCINHLRIFVVKRKVSHDAPGACFVSQRRSVAPVSIAQNLGSSARLSTCGTLALIWRVTMGQPTNEIIHACAWRGLTRSRKLDAAHHAEQARLKGK
jgi:hypothetical protein